MTVAVRSFETGASEGTGSTVTKPSGTVDGDYLLAIVASDETNNQWVGLPSGFVEIVDSRISQSATQPKFQVATKPALSEGANYGFTVPVFMSSIVWLFAITGCTASTIFKSAIARGTVAGSVSPNITAATHGGIDPLVFDCVAAITEYTARTFSTPSGMTSRGGNLNGAWMYGAGFSVGLSGAVDSVARTSTISGAEPWCACAVVAADPPAAGYVKGLLIPT